MVVWQPSIVSCRCTAVVVVVVAETRLHTLLSGVELGDRTPSQLLRYMKQLAMNNNVGDAVLKSLWLKSLPRNTRIVLSAQLNETTLDRLALIADKIHEDFHAHSVDAATISGPLCSQSLVNIENLSSQIATLTHRMNEMHSRGSRSSSSTRPLRSKSRQLKPLEPGHNGVCYYHRRFGDKARKCTRPCTHPKAFDETPPAGKRHSQPRVATAASSQLSNRLLSVLDTATGLRFLIDTGAEISVIPVGTKKHCLKPADLTLQAANSTEIKTYGRKLLTIDLSLRRQFSWTVTIADVNRPMDFITNFVLSVDLRHRQLADTETTWSVSGKTTIVHFLGLKPSVSTMPDFANAFRCYPHLVTPNQITLTIKHVAIHHFHNLSQPSILATTKLICDRFIWPGIRRDIRSWSRNCMRCQKCKVHLHTTTPPGRFPLPHGRFHQVHIDIVCPLPPSNGFTHVLTCIDRFTLWPVATQQI